jgi:DNA topoisomerase-2
MIATDETLSNKYQQKTDKEHILHNPDTYIGSVEEIEDDLWVMNDDGSRVVQRSIKYIPG